MRRREERSFGLYHDPVHHGHRVDGEVADGGLAGKHAGIGAVENRIGHIRYFGAGWLFGVMHALKHLSRHDHGLAMFATHLNDPLLGQRRLLDRDFNAQVASSDHHAIGGQHDGVEVIQCFSFFNFGDDQSPASFFIQQGTELPYLGGVAHKADADILDALPCRPAGVVAIDLAERRNAQMRLREIDTLTRSNRATIDDGAYRALVVTLDHLQA